MTDPVEVARRAAGLLTRIGFHDSTGAIRRLTAPPLEWWDTDEGRPIDSDVAAVVAALGRSADADASLAAVALLATRSGDARPALLAALRGDAAFARRLINLTGVSIALTEHIELNPDVWRALTGDTAMMDDSERQHRLLESVGADPHDLVGGTTGRAATVTGAAAILSLRQSYRRELTAIAGRDMGGDLPLQVVTEALADLAGHTVQAALSVAAAAWPAGSPDSRLAVIAMGKTGGRELNYISDVDVVFVADGDLEIATRLAAETMRICRAVAWEVDAALRPEGKDGPLVRTLASHEAYYARWASTWEFQALLKARPIAGDAELGARYVAAMAPLVWTAAERPNFVTDVQAMRRRVVAHVPARVVDRELKLGPGGLRDVEFAVQLLQLVHGRADETLRERATLAALEALRDGGYVGRDDAVSLGDAYRFLRAAEHRVQLRRLRRTHLVPDDPGERAVLARAMGFRPDARGDASAVFDAEWALHAREVRRLHEKLFYRPLLEAVARVPTEGLRLTPVEAGRRLAALGFADPPAALRHIEALTAGLSRRAALQRTLLPVLLSEFADAPDPDAGLLAYRQVSDALGETAWYLRTLRDEGAVSARLAYLLATSRYVTELFRQVPEGLQMLADEDQLKAWPADELKATMIDAAAPPARCRHRGCGGTGAAAAGVAADRLCRPARACRRRRCVRGDQRDDRGDTRRRAHRGDPGRRDRSRAATARPLRGDRDGAPGRVRDRIRLRRRRHVRLRRGRPASSGARGARDRATRRRADPRVARRAVERPAARCRRRPSTRGAQRPARPLAGVLRRVLRPLVIALGGAGAAAGPVRRRRCRARRPVRRRSSIPVRYPGRRRDDRASCSRSAGSRGGSTASGCPAAPTRRRTPSSAAAVSPTSSGRFSCCSSRTGGGCRACARPGRSTRVRAAVAADLLEPDDAQHLELAWRTATRARNAIMLVRDKAEDQLPASGTALVGVGRALGYPAGFDPGQFVDDYRRITRRARKVVEAVFYGGPSS